jgi:tRNA(Ile)-lysidine synthase
MRYALELQVRRTIRKYGMISPGERVLVAVSGGADSMALLECLHSLAPVLRITLVAAHLNHGIRGAEADQDEEFVRNHCRLLGCEFISESADVQRQASLSGQNLEECARQLRYAFLRRTARSLGAGKIAVGHTLNDQAETVLLRLLRGSGMQGLAAIHPVLDRQVIRPLIECSRAAIIGYLQQKQIGYREDSTNRDLHHLRNLARHKLLPFLEQNFNPAIVETLAREAELAREVLHYLEMQSGQAYEDMRRPHPDAVELPVGALLEFPRAILRNVIRLALRESRGDLRGIAARHIDSILSLCRPGQSGRRVLLPRGTAVIRQFKSLLFLISTAKEVFAYSYELPLPGSCDIADAGIRLVATIRSRREASDREQGVSPANFVVLDRQSLPDKLTVRSRLPGDRYAGMHRRKVKKMLIDAKVPLLRRSTLPMIVAGADVIWIPGFKPARSYRAHAASDSLVILELFSLSSAADR